MNLGNIEYSDRDITALSELMDEVFVQNGDVGQYINIVSARNGDQVGYIGEFADGGVAGNGCNPTYESLSIPNRDARWEIGPYQIAYELCASDMRASILSLGLSMNTDGDDMTGGEIMSNIISPRMERLISNIIWRAGWFGDTAASNVADGGSVIAGQDPKLVSMCDGLWKRIYTAVGADASLRTTIAANTETTAAARKTAMYKAGVPTGIIDSMRQNADERLEEFGAFIMVSKAFKDALHWDVKTTYKSNMEWDTIFAGFEVAQYDGITIVAIPEWDRLMKKYDVGATGLPNSPYRAAMIINDNMMIGVPDGKMLAELDIFFERKARTTNIFAKNEIGSMIGDTTLLHVAY